MEQNKMEQHNKNTEHKWNFPQSKAKFCPKFPKLKLKHTSSSLKKPSMNHMEPTNDISNKMKMK